MKTPLQEIEDSMKLIDLHPTLEEVVRKEGVDRTKLQVPLRVNGQDKPYIPDRGLVPVSDGEKVAFWSVASIRGLFRGEKTAPNLSGQPAPAYLPLFHFIEQHAMHFCDAAGDKTDGEFEEAYSNLRRRPDGKSMSELHAFLWQTAAVLVGLRPVSAAEFDAIFGRLAQSASTFRMGLVSRNYIETLRMCANRVFSGD